MLPVQERIFLYKYLAAIISLNVNPKEALAIYLKDTILKHKQKKELKKALFLFSKKQGLAKALYQANAIPYEEYIIAAQKVSDYNHLMNHLAKHLRFKMILKRKIKNALLYPSILIIELILIVSIAVFWLIPHIKDFFDKLHLATPTAISLLSKLSNSSLLQEIRASFVYIIILLPSTLWLMYQIYKLFHLEKRAGKLIMYIYKINKFYQLIALQNIFSTLSLLVFAKEQQQEIHHILKITASAIKNDIYKEALLSLAQHIEKGGLLSKFWEQKKNRILFPVLVRRIMTIAQTHNNYANEIHSIAEILNEEIEIELKHFISILEPLMILFIAFVVGVIAFSLQKMINEMQVIQIAGFG